MASEAEVVKSDAVWTEEASNRNSAKNEKGRRAGWFFTAVLTYQAIGVIYGDIGTSPLYTVASILTNVDTPTEDEIVMCICMIFWSLTLLVLIKYVLIVLHANDKGEGGTFALYTVLCRTLGISPFGTLQRPEHEQLVRISENMGNNLSRDAMGGLMRRTSLRQRNQAQMGPAAKVSMNGEEGSSMSPLDAAPPALRWWNYGHVPAEPIKRWFRGSWIAQRSLLAIAIVAVSMVFGDGVLTPAVSVVSAVSGLTVATNVDSDTIIGVSCAILVILFAFQFKGTHGVSALFSPIVILWLASNAAIGIYNLHTYDPSIFKALSPSYIYSFFDHFGVDGWRMLGAVMLSVTGCEAMFADLGHFNVAAVGISWTFYAYPCLVLTYLGQGAYLIYSPGDVGTTYWSSIPTAIFWPMLVLATLASVVASQALISACFSICKQAKNLGFIPHVKVVFTSKAHEGQIYIGLVNWILMVLTVAVVAGFQANSTQLGNAYGLTISAVMFVTTVMVSLIMIVEWKISIFLVALFFSVYALIDGAFVSANLTKVPVGGWVAIAITFGSSLLFFVWWAGQRRRLNVAHARFQPSDLFTFTTVGARKPLRTTVDGNTGFSFHDERKRVPGQAASEAYDATIASGMHVRDSYDSFSSYASQTEWIHPNRLSGGAGALGEGQETAVSMAMDTEKQQAFSKFTRDPTRDELGILRGEFNLALRMPGLTSKPLATLPGIALFYSDNADTVPPVMCHFLRNVEAVHEINIFVCVRYMPIPFIDPADRLLIRPVPGLPTFYQTVVRYGYMDKVDHSKPFINSLITSIVHVLEDRSGLRRTPKLINAVHDPTLDLTGPIAEGVMDVSSPSDIYTNSTRPVEMTTELNEIAVASETALATDSHGPAVFRPARMALDLNTLSRAIGNSSIGHALSQVVPAATLSRLGTNSKSNVPSGYQQLLSMADAVENTEVEIPAMLEDSARRVSALIKAASNGVVYYFGRSSLRMKADSNVFHDALYDGMYKPMLLLSYSEHEAWRVPADHLIELGMVVFI